MGIELSGVGLAAGIAAPAYGGENTSSSRLVRGTIYVVGGIAAITALTLAIPPLRRAFLAGIKGLGGLRKSPLDKATTMDGLIAALKRDPSQTEALKLVEAMDADRFYNAAPFRHLEDIEPIKRIVRRGVQGYERRIFRTSTNVQCWNSGYDFVEYEIRHADGGVSLARAFKYQTGPWQTLGIGSQDLRTTVHEFGILNADGSRTYLRLENGGIAEMAEGEAAAGLAQMRTFVEESLKGKGLVRLESPNQAVVL